MSILHLVWPSMAGLRRTLKQIRTIER